MTWGIRSAVGSLGPLGRRMVYPQVLQPKFPNLWVQVTREKSTNTCIPVPAGILAGTRRRCAARTLPVAFLTSLCKGTPIGVREYNQPALKI